MCCFLQDTASTRISGAEHCASMHAAKCLSADDAVEPLRLLVALARRHPRHSLQRTTTAGLWIDADSSRVHGAVTLPPGRLGGHPTTARRRAPHHRDPNNNHQIHYASDAAQSTTAAVRSQSPREPLGRCVLLLLRDCTATGQRQPLRLDVCVGTAASAVKSASYAERRPPSRPACHNLSEPVLREGYPYHDQ
jgi:hypothetical protein